MKHNVFLDVTGQKFYRTTIGWATRKDVAKELGYSDPEIYMPGNSPKEQESATIEKPKQLTLFQFMRHLKKIRRTLNTIEKELEQTIPYERFEYSRMCQLNQRQKKLNKRLRREQLKQLDE